MGKHKRARHDSGVFKVPRLPKNRQNEDRHTAGASKKEDRENIPPPPSPLPVSAEVDDSVLMPPPAFPPPRAAAAEPAPKPKVDTNSNELLAEMLKNPTKLILVKVSFL